MSESQLEQANEAVEDMKSKLTMSESQLEQANEAVQNAQNSLENIESMEAKLNEYEVNRNTLISEIGELKTSLVKTKSEASILMIENETYSKQLEIYKNERLGYERAMEEEMKTLKNKFLEVQEVSGSINTHCERNEMHFQIIIFNYLLLFIGK